MGPETRLILAISLVCVGCVDTEPPTQALRQPIISEGVDPILQDEHFNVQTHRNMLTRSGEPGTQLDRLRAWNAGRASRSTAMLLRDDREVLQNGSCVTGSEVGTGFLTGYATLVAADHVETANNFLQGPSSVPSRTPDPNDTETRPDVEDALDLGECEGAGCSDGGCVGEGCTSGEPRTLLTCGGMYKAYGLDWPGMGIGVTGGPFDDEDGIGIGDFGVVCGPWSSWSWTHFWHYVGHESRRAFDDRLINAYSGTRSMPLSHALVTDMLEPDPQGLAPPTGEHSPRPFQNCPSGFYLTGITLIMDGGRIEGVKDIECTNASAPGEGNGDDSLRVIPMMADLGTYVLYNAIGRPDAAGDEAYLTCAPGGTLISGFEVTADSDSRVDSIRPICSSTPPKLNLNQCDPANPQPLGTPF